MAVGKQYHKHLTQKEYQERRDYRLPHIIIQQQLDY